MTISITCGACNAAFRVKDEHAGKRGKCPRCQAVVEIPVLDEPEEEQEEKPPPQKKRPAAASPEETLQKILEAFSGAIEPPHTALLYRVGLVMLAALLLVLPVLYLAVIAAVGYLLYYHATENLEVVAEMRRWWAIVFFYAGPLIVGPVLLFFLVKPLFAKRSRSLRMRTLAFGEEPLLFALVTRVARAVGAPEPKRIVVDCQMNASAGFGSLLSGDLVLTLGLPLVAGLNIQQLAGVIAHELGHFAQGTAMRLSYLVRSINHWFARVVYERDDWDEALARGADKEDKLALALQLAMLCIWLTRCVLWVFFIIGHALSCFMLRQMEYDADRNETRLAGSAAFADIQRRIELLTLVTDQAFALAYTAWIKGGALPEDLCEWILAIAAHVRKDDIRRLETEMTQSRTSLFATHPAAGDRLASARREQAPGVFHMDGPTARLFKDFRKMSRSVSLDFYREVLGKQVHQRMLVPVATLLESKAVTGK